MQAAGSFSPSHTRRTTKVDAALAQWTGRLIDLSRRNHLLYFRDLRTGTLDLLSSEEGARSRLLDGERVRASALFPEAEALSHARKRLTELQRKIRLLAEERGINAGYLAFGLASWAAPQGTRGVATTRAPIILRPVSIWSKGLNAADFELQLGESAELNPVLAYSLARQAGVDTKGVADSVDEVAIAGRLELAIRLVQQRAAAAGVAVAFEEKQVVGAFAYEKLPMVRDLEESAELLAGHPLTAALAGDEEAAIRLRATTPPSTVDVNRIDPRNEHLVIDADPSQQAAIATILSGHHLIVQGPPGTGKSQTIANLIAEAAGRGLKVLFVAQKRAAIDAVVSNLERRDLGDIVLDLHDPKTSRRAVVEQLKSSMDRAGQETPPDVTELNRVLIDRRSRLINHADAMNRIRQPAGMSIEQLQQNLLELPPTSDQHIVITRSALERIPLPRLHRLQDELTDFVDAGGLRWWRGETPWSRAHGVATQDDLRALRAHLDDLTGSTIRDARRALDQVLESTGLPRPTSVAQWGEALTLLGSVGLTIEMFGPDVFDQDLDERRAAFATRAWRRDAGLKIGVFRARSLRAAVNTQRRRPASRTDTFAELSAAIIQRDQWARLSGGRLPQSPPPLHDAHARFESLRNALAAIGAAAFVDGLTDRTESDVDHELRVLKDDEPTLLKLPGFNQDRRQLEQLGLTALMDVLARLDMPSNEAVNALRFAWLSSWLRELRVDVAEYGRFGAVTQNRLVDEFREADRQHVALAAARVRREVARRQIHARDTLPEQRQIVVDQVTRKRRHKPIRQLVEEAPELLLAVRPCWAMSPLVVSQVLPARELFDLVVFDEASQIEPADAIPAIMRGSTIAVAGDNRQLPPTPFFATTGVEDGDADDTDLGDFESILDVLSKFIPAETLAWHYRSQDERLIAFSNHAIYEDRLVTFPGTALESSLRHIVVDAPAPPGGKAYSQAEVNKIVDLIVDHAQSKPGDSLGVIALGANGASAIDTRLRQTLVDRPELAAFFDENADVGRRFFAKSIENVQGDERDTIILAISASRTATGGISHHFGPINQKGGERRLNVAVTRARRALTVVSNFTHNDLQEDKLTNAGLRFLHGYLRYASQQSAGKLSTSDGNGSPIEERVLERLHRAGVQAHPRYGVAGSRIDIAAEHPTQPGRMLFAIETDGPHYYADRSVRERDRLRPQQLEKLGWRHHRIWTTEWLSDPDDQTARLLAKLSAPPPTDPAPGPEQPASDPAPPRPPAPIPSANRRLPRPRGLDIGTPIHRYSHAVLVDLARWIDSDGLLRDEEQMIEVMMAELGYRRRGKNIVDALRMAVRSTRNTSGSH
jgi:hypothetical protein